MSAVDSGIKMHPEASEAIGDLGKGKLGFIVMRIGVPEGEAVEKVIIKEKLTTSDCEQQVQKEGVVLKNDETATWYCFRKALAAYDIVYGAGFVHYTTRDGRPNASKLIFVTWNTDGVKMKEKMKYSSTKVYNKLPSGTVNHQASDEDDISYLEIVEGKLNRK